VRAGKLEVFIEREEVGHHAAEFGRLTRAYTHRQLTP
jgi:hypothetical protein